MLALKSNKLANRQIRYCFSSAINKLAGLKKEGLNIRLQSKNINNVSIHFGNLKPEQFSKPYVSINMSFKHDNGTETNQKYFGYDIEATINNALDDFNSSKE